MDFVGIGLCCQFNGGAGWQTGGVPGKRITIGVAGRNFIDQQLVFIGMLNRNRGDDR